MALFVIGGGPPPDQPPQGETAIAKQSNLPARQPAQNRRSACTCVSGTSSYRALGVHDQLTTLGITGLVQKYSASPLSQAIVTGLGGIENTRLIHHVAPL
jgi:hypothetical protein